MRTYSSNKKKRKATFLASMLLSLDTCILTQILVFLPDYDDSRLNAILSSKVLFNAYNSKQETQEGIQTKIVPTLVLRPSKKRNGGSTQKVIEKLSRILINSKKKKNLQKITHLVVEDVHKFDDVHNNVQLRGCQLDNIVSLKMSYRVQQHTNAHVHGSGAKCEHRSFLAVLDAILPNLEIIYISNTNGNVRIRKSKYSNIELKDFVVYSRRY
mmetsp:Transcript_54827/g.61275  ORF Transcript_54827/g.61275 Transcript_54827/m.61275 type:complete len:213 (+) Transcript_54827:276-914(+)